MRYCAVAVRLCLFPREQVRKVLRRTEKLRSATVYYAVLLECSADLKGEGVPTVFLRCACSSTERTATDASLHANTEKCIQVRFLCKHPLAMEVENQPINRKRILDFELTVKQQMINCVNTSR